MSQVFAVFACGDQGEFASDTTTNGIPFDFPKDLKWFKELTKGKRLVASQKTFDSIPNGLPGREVYISTREGIKIPHTNQLMTLGQHSGDVYVIGGATVIKALADNIEFLFVSVIDRTFIEDALPEPRLHPIDFIDKFDVVFAGQNKALHKDDNQVSQFYVLKNKKHPESTLPKEIKELIYKHFEPYIKLKVKEHKLIKPDAHGLVKVCQKILVPVNQTGVLSIRLSLAKRGIFTEGTTFKSNKVCTDVEVVVTNKSVTDIDLFPNQEIGEIAFNNNHAF